jgi:hypothetical protein
MRRDLPAAPVAPGVIPPPTSADLRFPLELAYSDTWSHTDGRAVRETGRAMVRRLASAEARVRELEAENARLRARVDELEMAEKVRDEYA